MAKKKKQEEKKPKPTITDVVGRKLKDASRENGETLLHFTGGIKVKMSGYVSFEIEEE